MTKKIILRKPYQFQEKNQIFMSGWDKIALTETVSIVKYTKQACLDSIKLIPIIF